MSAPSGWQIEQAMSVLQALAARLHEESDADENALGALLQAKAPDCMDVLRNVIRASLDAKAFAEAVDARMDALQKRRDRYRRRAEAMRGAAMAAMDALGLPKIVDAEFTATLRAGTPAPVVTDEAALPAEYWRIKREVNMTAVYDAVKCGEIPPGVDLANGMPVFTVRSK